MSVIILSLFFFVCLCFSGNKILITNKIFNSRKTILIFSILLILLSTFRPVDWGADTSSYISMYNEIINGAIVDVELFFTLISLFVDKFFNNVVFVFFIFAFLSITVKCRAILSLSSYPIISWLIYFSCWFMLHDMYQIRVGASIAFFYLSILFIKQKKILSYSICCFIACSFHIQAIVMVPLFFLSSKKIRATSVIVYEFFIGVAYLVYFLKIDFFLGIVNIAESLPIPRVHQLSYYYSVATESNLNLGKINAFSPIVLVRLFMTIFLLNQYKILNKNKFYPILIRIMCIAFIFRMICYPIPVLGMRVYEYLSSIEIFLYPLFLTCIKEKKIVYTLLILYCLFFLLLRLWSA